MNNRPADLLELFSSIQGEGLLVGLRQVFIRFFGCNLSCGYCDTLKSELPPFCITEETPGSGNFREIENPVNLESVLDLLLAWQRIRPGIHHSISITGGEPLIHHDVLLEWLPPLREILPICLETNGVLHRELSQLISHIDHISMDIKLPSTSNIQDQWDNHREFLRIAAAKNVFVKTIVDNSSQVWEITRTCEIISSVDCNIPLILQPVTLKTGIIDITSSKLFELQEAASGILTEVRIIPQTHKYIGFI